MSLEYFYLAPLLLIAYAIAVDTNLSEYLYLKLFRESLLFIQTSLLKYKLLLQLRYDTFLIKRGIVPRRFHKMAKEISDTTNNPK